MSLFYNDCSRFLSCYYFCDFENNIKSFSRYRYKEYNTHKFFKRVKTLNNLFACYTYYSFSLFDGRMRILLLYFSDLSLDILRLRCFLMERFSHFNETPETLNRVTWANLSRHIPRPLSESLFARPTFVRFNSGVRFDCSTS